MINGPSIAGYAAALTPFIAILLLTPLSPRPFYYIILSRIVE